MMRCFAFTYTLILLCGTNIVKAIGFTSKFETPNWAFYDFKTLASVCTSDSMFIRLYATRRHHITLQVLVSAVLSSPLSYVIVYIMLSLFLGEIISFFPSILWTPPLLRLACEKLAIETHWWLQGAYSCPYSGRQVQCYLYSRGLNLLLVSYITVKWNKRRITHRT